MSADQDKKTKPRYYYYVAHCVADGSWNSGTAMCQGEFNVAGVTAVLANKKDAVCIVTFYSEISAEQYETIHKTVFEPNRLRPAPVLQFPLPAPIDSPPAS